MKIMVLVLDDESHIRRDLYKHLTARGYDVCVAENSEEASRLLQATKIDFAIIDLKIDYTSEYGGIRVIEDLNRRQPKAKAIVLSAYEMDEDIANRLRHVVWMSYVRKGGLRNYILAVLDEIERLKGTQNRRKCFVIMPFSGTGNCTQEEWREIFDNVIKWSVEGSGYQYECFRASLSMGNIIRDVLDNLNRADVVIADMTDQNANVFYELGVRHALRDPTVLIAQRIDDVPFDLQGFAVVIYEWKTESGRARFRNEIKRILGEIENDRDGLRITSPVREYLEGYPNRLGSANDS